MLKRFFELCSSPTTLRLGERLTGWQCPIVTDPANPFMNSAEGFKWDTLARESQRFKRDLKVFFLTICE